jgi:hypothetical protein
VFKELSVLAMFKKDEALKIYSQLQDKHKDNEEIVEIFKLLDD